jgi:hypothetical protein
MDKSGADKEVALSYINLLNEDMLTSEASALVKTAYEEAVVSWREKVNIAIQKIGSIGRFAGRKKIILCRDPKWASAFGKILNQGLPENDLFETNISIEQVIFESSLIGV